MVLSCRFSIGVPVLSMLKVTCIGQDADVEPDGDSVDDTFE